MTSRNGTTLAELMVAIGLIAVMLAIAVPTIQGRSFGYELMAQMNLMAADVQSARALALQNGTAVTLRRIPAGWQVESGGVVVSQRLTGKTVSLEQGGAFAGGPLVVAASGAATPGEIYFSATDGSAGRVVVSVAGAPLLQRLRDGVYQ